MKKFAVLFLWIYIASSIYSNAATPQKVYSIANENRNAEWYREQMDAWKKVLDKNKNNPEAWQYYFTASRMLINCTPAKTNEEIVNNTKRTENLLKDMKKAVPNSFEYYYCKAWNLVGTEKADSEGFEALSKAAEIDPSRTELISFFVIHYEKIQDLQNRKKYNEKWYNSNTVSPILKYFAYNMLESVEDNAIIITSGDNDSYPLWMLQDAENIKPGVVVLNYNLMMIDSYRDKIFKSLNMPKLELVENDFNPGENYFKMPAIQKILQHIMKKSHRPVYFSNTDQPELYSDYNDKLYLTGLTFKYSEKSIDNIAILRNNFENVFQLDYLKHYLYYEPYSSASYFINMTYIPALIKLYQHYKVCNDNHNMLKIRKIVESIYEISKKIDENGFDKDLMKNFE